MPLTIGVIKEVASEETRVALTPEVAAKFSSLGASILLERGAGANSFLADENYSDAEFEDSAADVLAKTDLLLKVQPPTLAEVEGLKEGAVVIDAGFNPGPNGNVGDVDYDDCAPKCSMITPVPGGVGPMTLAVLIDQTSIGAARQLSANVNLCVV